MAHIKQLPNDCNGDGGAAAEDSAVDENNRTVCWLKYVTALTDLSHVPAFASQYKLPEAAVSALDAVMEDYRCNGPTVASQQVLCNNAPPVYRVAVIRLKNVCQPLNGTHTTTAVVHDDPSWHPRLLAWATVALVSGITDGWLQQGAPHTSVQAADSKCIRF